MQRSQRVQIDSLQQMQAKVGPHASAQHFGRPQCSRAFERNDLLKAKGTRAAQDGADVARVLDSVQYYTGLSGGY